MVVVLANLGAFCNIILACTIIKRSKGGEFEQFLILI